MVWWKCKSCSTGSVIVEGENPFGWKEYPVMCPDCVASGNRRFQFADGGRLVCLECDQEYMENNSERGAISTFAF